MAENYDTFVSSHNRTVAANNKIRRYRKLLLKQRAHEAEDFNKKPIVNLERIERVCLRCGEKFTAKGKHERLCGQTCKSEFSGDIGARPKKEIKPRETQDVVLKRMFPVIYATQEEGK